MKPKDADDYVHDPPGVRVFLTSPKLTVSEDERFERWKKQRSGRVKKHVSRKKSAKRV